MNAEALTLLEHAEALLGGLGSSTEVASEPLNSAQSTRAAAWLARSSLESAITSLLTDQGLHVKEAWMRSRMACLHVLFPALAHDASAAWWGLSRCYHHHAFELTPTPTEVAHLLTLVRAVVMAID